MEACSSWHGLFMEVQYRTNRVLVADRVPASLYGTVRVVQ
jgi:hypothetical protein